MDFTKEPKTVISLCTGIRGLERGLERSGVDLRVLCYVEIEAIVIENLVQQMEQGVLAEAPIFSDIKKFDGRPFRGMVDIITAGYPCQPFSVAGDQLGTEDPRHLWPHVFRIVTAVRPVLVWLENVPGHLGIGFREVRSQLQGLGYKVEAGIFSAAEVGAPHQRKRLFILAVENSARERWRGRSDVREDGGRTLQTERPRSLADSDNDGERARSGEIKSESKEIEGTQQRKERNKKKRERMRDKPGNESSGIKLADSPSIRLEGLNADGRNSKQKEEEKERSGTIGEHAETRWPARPGEEQAAWEPPRIESVLGYVFNGYDYREDLLRMAGNAVVEQTAEVAIITLLKKHGIELNP